MAQPTTVGRSPMWLARILHEDWATNGRSLFTPGLRALAVHRLSTWAHALPRPVGLPVRVVARLLFYRVRGRYGIELPPEAVIGRRLQIAHQNGLVLNPRAVIGDDCLLRHNVTLGAATDERWDEAPVLGDGVQVGPGAVILGRVHVGDGARIGPNALVLHDVPAGSRVLAPLATVRPKKERRTASRETDTELFSH